MRPANVAGNGDTARKNACATLGTRHTRSSSDSLSSRSIAPNSRFVAHYVTDAIRPLEVQLWKFS